MRDKGRERNRNKTETKKELARESPQLNVGECNKLIIITTDAESLSNKLLDFWKSLQAQARAIDGYRVIRQTAQVKLCFLVEY